MDHKNNFKTEQCKIILRFGLTRDQGSTDHESGPWTSRGFSDFFFVNRSYAKHDICHCNNSNRPNIIHFRLSDAI